MSYFGGIDIGTSSVKLVAMNENGTCGKSVLLNMISGQEKPTSGQIEFTNPRKK